jgi:hypothetical protein
MSVFAAHGAGVRGAAAAPPVAAAMLSVAICALPQLLAVYFWHPLHYNDPCSRGSVVDLMHSKDYSNFNGDLSFNDVETSYYIMIWML